MNRPLNLRTLAGATTLALLAVVVTLPARAEVTQQFHRTVPLTANGTISLESINGDVEITGWNRNEVQIDAVKSATTQEKLNELNIDVNATSDSVSIETKFAHHMFANNDPGSVHYTLRVPQNARIDKVNLVNGGLRVQKLGGEIHADLVNGMLQASDLTGTADLTTVNGELDADYSSLGNVRQVKLSTVNGKLNLTLPPSANAEVSANSVNGSISTDFPLEVKGHMVGKSLSGTLGSGGTNIELSTVNGSIHLGPSRSTL